MRPYRRDIALLRKDRLHVCTNTIVEGLETEREEWRARRHGRRTRSYRRGNEDGEEAQCQAVVILIPEAWQGNDIMEPEKKAFYNWAACLQEPWDGPALCAFSDGRYCGANLDRNGLRPCRYVVTNEDIIVWASEVGAVYIGPEKVIQKGRLKSGRMLLVDTVEGRIVDDKELKRTTARKQNFASCVESNMLDVPAIVKRVQRSLSR